MRESGGVNTVAKLPTAAASLLAGARGCDCGGALHAPALVQYLAQYCTTVPPIGDALQQQTVGSFAFPRKKQRKIEGSWRSSARHIWAGAVAVSSVAIYATLLVETPASIEQRALELRGPPSRTRAEPRRHDGATFIYVAGAAFRWAQRVCWMAQLL